MRHLLLIDSLEKLNINKDSTLMFALTLKLWGIEVYVFFENDFSVHNQGLQKLTVQKFGGSFKEDGIYLNSFTLSERLEIELNTSDVIHMRLDPPFDSRYQRILWMLDELSVNGIKVINHPRGIMLFNEKLYAYRTVGATPSFIGSNLNLAKQFVQQLKSKSNDLILKPMDLYSGIGVEKLPMSDWEERFVQKVLELKGPVILQPFIEAVKQGEIRSIYFKQKELGTILKKPKEGEFLSNIAQGATFESYELSSVARSRCEMIVKELSLFGVDWIAFDILGDAISEVNITCPGLLVEVSFSMKKNLAKDMIKLMRI